jgi:hypothetical protein
VSWPLQDLLQHLAALERRVLVLSQAQRRPVTAATRAKLRAARLGQQASFETRAKLRAARLGKRLSAATRAKIGASQRRRWAERRQENGR